MKRKYKIVFFNFENESDIKNLLKQKKRKWQTKFISKKDALMKLLKENGVDSIVLKEGFDEKIANFIKRHYFDVALVQIDDDFSKLEEVIENALSKKGRVENSEGILITHGTDTLSWAFAYLRYSLKGLKGNVGITGSQIPFEGEFSPSDAIGNIRTALYFIARLKPPHLFAVFNNGRDVFSGRLVKYRKWDTESFEGRLAAKVTHQGIKMFRDDWVLIPFSNHKLEKLHLLRTGGTIESSQSEKGLKPRNDVVATLLKESLKSYFRELKKYDLFSLDSSNISFEEWEKISKKLEEIGLCKSDTNFDKSIKPVLVNPLLTSEDYDKLFSICGSGAVLLGYGAGNANTLKKSLRSVLNPTQNAIKNGKFVVISSQVPLEPYDAEYESGKKLLEIGGIPCGDLSIADCQVKLSYILGHKDYIREMAKKSKLSFELLVISSFLSGVSLSHTQLFELKKYLLKKRKGIFSSLSFDPFVYNSFKEGLSMVVEDLLESGAGERI